MQPYLMALDAGTTSSRCLIFDAAGRVVSIAQREFSQYYPQPGWVEHDGLEIWQTQLSVAREALEKAQLRAGDIAAIGIADQRETTLVWERDSGKPLCNAIVWQCRRTADHCRELERRGLQQLIADKTGLLPDAYFSATKLSWILDNIPGARLKAQQGRLMFGTVDSWLLWQLSGGRLHISDYSNASRTMMFNIHTLDWDDDILSELNIPRSLLPQVLPSAQVYGSSDASCFGAPIALAGMAGDQQAALFGQGCLQPGQAKNTYGTGCFLLMNCGQQPPRSCHGLLTTIAWGIEGRVDYALEGSVFSAGSAIQWLRDELGLLSNAAESEARARAVPDSNGCYVVPAFTGLGAPHWDAYARGCITGLTRGVNSDHIIRATLESLAYQTYDVLRAMESDRGQALRELRVDGGAAANDFLLQFQADLIQAPLRRPACLETTAWGAAALAGLGIGLWPDSAHIQSSSQPGQVFYPQMDEARRVELLQGWEKAVSRAKSWIE